MRFPPSDDPVVAELLAVWYARLNSEGRVCRRCGHVLDSRASIARGYGPKCWKVVQRGLSGDLAREPETLPLSGSLIPVR